MSPHCTTLALSIHIRNLLKKDGDEVVGLYVCGFDKLLHNNVKFLPLLISYPRLSVFPAYPSNRILLFTSPSPLSLLSKV